MSGQKTEMHMIIGTIGDIAEYKADLDSDKCVSTKGSSIEAYVKNNPGVFFVTTVPVDEDDCRGEIQCLASGGLFFHRYNEGAKIHNKEITVNDYGVYFSLEKDDSGKLPVDTDLYFITPVQKPEGDERIGLTTLPNFWSPSVSGDEPKAEAKRRRVESNSN